MPNLTRKTETIEQCRDELLRAAGLLDSVLKGELYQTDVAGELGIDRRRMQYETLHGFRPYVKARLLEVDDLFQQLESIRTPGDILLLEVFGYKDADKDASLLLLPEYDEGELWDAVYNRLTNREYAVIRMYTGYDDGRRRSEQEIGREFNLTRERVRQIKDKAIRRLRHPATIRTLFPGSSVDFSDCVYAMLRATDEAVAKYGRARNRYDAAKEIENATEAMDELVRAAEDAIGSMSPTAKSLVKEPIPTEQLPVMTLDELRDTDELSIRSYNCLTRAGYRTLNDLAGKTLEDLMEVRNLGFRSAREVESLMERRLGVVTPKE